MTSATPTGAREEEAAVRPNRVWMPGMIWNADHVLHLALKQETQTIPSQYFQDCEGILLLNIVEVGLLVSGSYGTGVLLAKNETNGTWSLPCSMYYKSVGVGSLGTAVKDLIVFIFDRQSLENLATSSNGLRLEHSKPRATLGPLRRYDTHQPQVSSKAITDDKHYEAFSYTKGAFAGITGDFASVGPYQDVNEAFYKKKGQKEEDITPQAILFGTSIKVPSKNADTLLPDVYEKLDMLSKGVKYDGSEKIKSDVAEQAPRSSVTRKASTSSTKSSSTPVKHPSTAKQSLSTKASNGATSRPSVTKSASAKSTGSKSRPSVTKSASAKSRPSVTKSTSEKRPSVTQTASTKATNKPVPTRVLSSKSPNKPIARPSVTDKSSLATSSSIPAQKSRPSVTKKVSVKAKSAAERRTSIEIPGYNC